jgi:tRNA A37 methylthiotransferase MiaB
VRSRPLVDIISETERLADRGYKEIVLTGIETSAYDYAPLSELIRTIDRIKGIERLRFGSLSPNSITDDFLEAAVDHGCLCCICIRPCSRMPTGLKLMRRPYNKKQMCANREDLPACQDIAFRD